MKYIFSIQYDYLKEDGKYSDAVFSERVEAENAEEAIKEFRSFRNHSVESGDRILSVEVYPKNIYEMSYKGSKEDYNIAYKFEEDIRERAIQGVIQSER